MNEQMKMKKEYSGETKREKTKSPKIKYYKIISYHSFLLELQPLLFLFPFFGTFVKQQPLLQRNFQHAQPFLGGVQLVWTGSKIQHERKHWSENGSVT